MPDAAPDGTRPMLCPRQRRRLVIACFNCGRIAQSRPNGTSDDADILRYCSASGRSHRLLKFEHELVDRLAARPWDREVARILGVAPEIAFGALRLLCNKN